MKLIFKNFLEMAKKAVASFGGGKGASKSKVKCIRMVKSTRGAYAFLEEMVPTEAAKEFFEKK